MSTDFLNLFNPTNIEAIRAIEPAVLAGIQQKLAGLRPVADFRADPRPARGDKILVIRTDRWDLLVLSGDPESLTLIAHQCRWSPSGPIPVDEEDPCFELWTIRVVDKELRAANADTARRARRASDLPRVVEVAAWGVARMHSESRNPSGAARLGAADWELAFDGDELRSLRSALAQVPSLDEFFDDSVDSASALFVETTEGNFVVCCADPESLTVYALPLTGDHGIGRVDGRPSLRLIRVVDGVTSFIDERDAQAALAGTPAPALLTMREGTQIAVLHWFRGGVA